MSTKWLTLTGLALACTLFGRSTLAVPLIDHSAGLKLLAGADIWTEPSNVPAGNEGVYFPGTAGGFGYGALGYYDLRIIKLIGVEAGLAYQQGTFKRKVTYNGLVDVTESITTHGLRLPILAKLNIPVGFGRLWFGLGPEFTLYQTSSSKTEVEAAATVIGLNLSTRNVKPVFGTAGFGLVIDIPVIDLEIPLEFRASKNFTQPSDWLDRVTPGATGQGAVVRAESSWVLRLGAGLGYRF